MMITLAWVVSQQEVDKEHDAAKWKTNQENWGGIKRREDILAHSMSRKTNPEEFERGQKEAYVLPTSQKPSCWTPSWLRDEHTTRKDPESPNMGQARGLARDNPDTNHIVIKPEIASYMSEQFSQAPLPCCFLPRRPFPIESFDLSVLVSSDNSFPSVRQEPTLGPCKGVPFLQRICIGFRHNSITVSLQLSNNVRYKEFIIQWKCWLFCMVLEHTPFLLPL